MNLNFVFAYIVINAFKDNISVEDCAKMLNCTEAEIELIYKILEKL